VTPATPAHGGRVNVPAIGAQVPRRGNAFTTWVATTGMRLIGWRFEGPFPDVPKCVLIVAPHTSNWDFPIGVMAMYALGIRGTFLGKHTLFRFPLGAVMRFLGGVPVDRAAAADVVGETVKHVQAHPGAVIVLSPEGTRRLTTRWKSGFYRIAERAQLPIFPIGFDYARKTIVFHPLFTVTGALDRDIAALQALYRPSMAKFPAQYLGGGEPPRA
jgi:1-acyl-sn-glycerol-3-phosphate acyltransferase